MNLQVDRVVVLTWVMLVCYYMGLFRYEQLSCGLGLRRGVH